MLVFSTTNSWGMPIIKGCEMYCFLILHLTSVSLEKNKTGLLALSFYWYVDTFFIKSPPASPPRDAIALE